MIAVWIAHLIAGLNLDEYLAKVLESYFTAFIEILQNDQLAIAVNYDEGAVDIVKKIANATGIRLQQEEIETMQLRTGFHGKYPEQKFEEHSLGTGIPTYQKNVFELYETIEKIRTAETKPA